MPTVLITGANRGLGLEFARQYAADGWRVIATCRDPSTAGDLAGIGGQVEIAGLDVTDGEAVQALAARLDGPPAKDLKSYVDSTGRRTETDA